MCVIMLLVLGMLLIILLIIIISILYLSFNKMLHQHYIRKFTRSFNVTGLVFRSLSGIAAECNYIFLIFS